MWETACVILIVFLLCRQIQIDSKVYRNLMFRPCPHENKSSKTVLVFLLFLKHSVNTHKFNNISLETSTTYTVFQCLS